jgi:rubrerythrin
MKNNISINSKFYKLDGTLSDKLDYHLDSLELLRLVYINQYTKFTTKHSYSTRLEFGLKHCEKLLIKKIKEINILLRKSNNDELKSSIDKIRTFERIVSKLEKDIPLFNNGKLISRIKREEKHEGRIAKNTNPFYEGNDEELLDPQISQFVQLTENKNKQRLEELQKLNQDMEFLKEMFVDLQQITAQQEPLIDDILENVEETNTNTEGGVGELIRAHNYQVNMFGYKLGLFGGLIGVAIGGPVGFVVLGTKIAMGIGATTVGLVGAVSGNHISDQYREPEPESE